MIVPESQQDEQAISLEQSENDSEPKEGQSIPSNEVSVTSSPVLSKKQKLDLEDEDELELRDFQTAIKTRAGRYVTLSLKLKQSLGIM